jgi:transcriptional regulator with XRE-family HTH domain
VKVLETHARLRELRRARGLSVMALAVGARCSATTITAIELYGYLPRRETRARVAEALGVEPNDLWPNDVASAAHGRARALGTR